jgi:hypothetical protein
MKRYKPIVEGKATFFDVTKLKYFSVQTITELLNSAQFSNKRVTYDSTRNIVGGTQKDTKELIKVLIQNDKKAGEELGVDISKEQKEDYKYLKSIK